MFCEKCGHEVKNGQLVCGYCGHAVSLSDLSEETKAKISETNRSDASLQKNHYARFKGFGIALMIVSGILDIVSIAMVGSSGVEEFKYVLIASSVTFFVGLLITSV